MKKDNMPIQLEGLSFDPQVISELENELSKNGYSPDDFHINKSVHLRPMYGYGREYDYRVTIQGKSFSITFANDAYFASFFINLCCSEDSRHGVGELLDKLLIKVEQRIEITKHWLIEDPFKK